MSDGERTPYRDARRSIEDRLADLMQRMSLDEKIAQLGAIQALDVIGEKGFDRDKASKHLRYGTGQMTRLGGSTVLPPDKTAEIVNDIQRYLLENTRLGIPAIIHEESLVGYVARNATQFPQAIGLASTWQPELVQEMAAVIRRQMLAAGARLALAPVLDVARDPRWGRCEETFGEDPYLISRMGVAYVRGLQGEDLSQGVVATAKHFMGYGVPQGGRNWAPCQLPIRELLEGILPPFEAVVREAGIGAVMNAYQEIDGIPSGASRWLLTDLLRDELGFEGVVLADYTTVLMLLLFHRIAADKAEAAARALRAGLDTELPNIDCYGEPLKEAIRAGRYDESLIDPAVARVLRQKLELGLFDEPFVQTGKVLEVFDRPQHRQLARRLAQKSAVLLKNDAGLLPLDPNMDTLAVIGPNADSILALQGDYSYPVHVQGVFGVMRDQGHKDVEDEDTPAIAPTVGRDRVDLFDHFIPSVSVLDGIKNVVGKRTKVTTALGCGVTGDSEDGFDQAVKVARQADAAVVVVGGRSGLIKGATTGESRDASDLSLTGKQAELVKAVAATGTPTVVVVLSGRVHALTNIVDSADALLEAWCPGEEGGNGIADVLFGRVSPAGRLPVSLPVTSGQIPLYYNHKPSGAVSMWHGDYTDQPVRPLFPFGHGLTYTTFEYGDLSLSSTTPGLMDTLSVSARISNTGTRTSDEVVQLYVWDRVATMTRPVKELKGFARISLGPGQAAIVRFDLDLKQLAFYDEDMAYVVEPGEFTIMVGASSEDIRLEETITTVGETQTVVRREVRPTGVVLQALSA